MRQLGLGKGMKLVGEHWEVGGQRVHANAARAILTLVGKGKLGRIGDSWHLKPTESYCQKIRACIEEGSNEEALHMLDALESVLANNPSIPKEYR